MIPDKSLMLHGAGIKSVAASQVNSHSLISSSNTSQFQKVINQIKNQHCEIDKNARVKIEQTAENLMSNTATMKHSLEQIIHRTSEIDSVLTSMKQSGTKKSKELIELQGMLLNYSLDLSAVSKLIEHTIGAVKTLLQTQV